MSENENENENEQPEISDFEAALGWMPRMFPTGQEAAAREPSAEMRQAATQMFEMYTGFRHAGFSAAEALRLVAYIARPPSE